MSDHHAESVRGLPAELPPGEQLLWQGAPNWQVLARRAFHVRKLAGYFGALVLWHVGDGVVSGQTLAVAARGAALPLALALAALAIVAGLAYLNARCTVYTVTSRRVVIRTGVALPVTINLPFRMIDGAQLRLYAGGVGDIPLQLSAAERIGYLVTWPSVRPWRVTRTEPMLRAIDGAAAVGELLGEALASASASAAAAASGATSAAPRRRPSSEPVAA